MKVKKISGIIVAVVMVLGSLTGCQSAGAEKETAAKTETKAETKEETKAETAAEVIETAVSEAAEEESKEITLGISIFTRTHVFYNRVEEAMEKKCEELGVKGVFVDADTDSDKQLSQVQDFITQKVDAIIICPVSTAGSNSCLELANKAEIPLLTAFTKSDGDSMCHFGTDRKSVV